MTKAKKTTTPKKPIVKQPKEFTYVTLSVSGPCGSGKSALLGAVIMPALAQNGIGVIRDRDLENGLRLAIPVDHFKRWAKPNVGGESISSKASPHG